MHAPIAMMYRVGDPLGDRWVWYRMVAGDCLALGNVFELSDLTADRLGETFDAGDFCLCSFCSSGEFIVSRPDLCRSWPCESPREDSTQASRNLAQFAFHNFEIGSRAIISNPMSLMRSIFRSMGKKFLWQRH